MSFRSPHKTRLNKSMNKSSVASPFIAGLTDDAEMRKYIARLEDELVEVEAELIWASGPLLEENELLMSNNEELMAKCQALEAQCGKLRQQNQELAVENAQLKEEAREMRIEKTMDWTRLAGGGMVMLTIAFAAFWAMRRKE